MQWYEGGVGNVDVLMNEFNSAASYTETVPLPRFILPGDYAKALILHETDLRQGMYLKNNQQNNL